VPLPSTHGHRPFPLTLAKLDDQGLPKGHLNVPEAAAFCDATTITELCNDVPEVEIITLLEEQLPHYKLRADSVFGYEHHDWIQTPMVPSDVPGHLTPTQIQETLQYFLLCSERVSQVTKTYHDIEAVTSLLEEKERDLELAARIGQSLLKQNCSLSKQNELLEDQLELAREEIAQLRHEVAMRDNLLHLYTDTVEESEPSSAAPTPLRHCDSSVSLQHCIQLDTLQQKLRGLEEENQQLRLEATSIVTETCQYEDQEQQLMLDCVEQFSEVSQQVALLSEELARKTEDQARQQEEISALLAQIVGLQQRCRAYGTEMEELQQHLASAREVQRKLRTEVQDLQEKYAECDGLLNEAQEELKKLRLQSLPSGTISHYNSVYSLPLDSLAAEIKGTMRKGTETPSSSDYRNVRRVFEMVKAVNQGSRSGSGSLHPLPGSPPSSVAGSPSGTPRPKHHCSDAPCGVLPLEEAPGEEEKKVGRPGTPGRQDLELALQRLTAWKEAQEAEPTLEKLGRDAESSSGVLTPSESLLSGSSDPLGGSIFSMGSLSYLPDKLQIVKPLEGSVTLHHWQQLAQPHLAGILDPRPGVLTKDFRQLEVDIEKVYSLQDPEEDEEEEKEMVTMTAASRAPLAKDKAYPLLLHSVNNLPQTPATYTITTCRLVCPSSDVTSVTPSLCHSTAPCCSPAEGISPIHPRPPQALMSLLKEQGISAVSKPTLFLPLAPGWRGWPLGSFGLARELHRDVPGAGGGKTSGFSINLVQKLRQLGLDRVVARGASKAWQVGAQEPPDPGPAAPRQGTG
ncbi:trafficking kinesin-binding protein 1, partial [Monodelphis domestica]|uniref:trafficking kinesin-binding protein 1 n=1 Tax=Monodelphis domestica TaxID=13616 RepID=UPI0024E25F69